jgi:alkylation response protein AidB-like acyl-CoA dehydrogenase
MDMATVRARAVGLADRLAPAAAERMRQRRAAGSRAISIGAGAREVTELQRRVAELEAEVQENRQLNSRLAELTDVVAELLVPLAERDEARVEQVLRLRAGVL